MKIAAIAAGALVLVVGAMTAWLGMFDKVRVAEAEMGPYAFVYVQEASDDFGRVGEITKSLGQRLEQGGVTARKPAQVYYPTGRGIQNQVGFVVDGAIGQGVLDFTTFFRNVPRQRYVTASFPYRNPLSYLAGHFRVVPRLEAHRKEKGIPESSSMVILDGDTLIYLQPVLQGG